MPDTTTAKLDIAVDPDGVPVALHDLAGDVLDGTLWGAARVGGAVALVVTEFDHFDHQPVPPTPGMMRALADALDSDPDQPLPLHGSRAWEKRRADKLAADVEQAQQSIREYAADADRDRQAYERVLGDLRRANEIIEQQAAELARAQRRLAVLKYGEGTLKLARAAVYVRERRRAAALVRLTAAAALAVGYLIGRDR